LYTIELNETDEKDTIIRKLVKIIREEDLITCSKKEIKILFREVKEKEKATKVIDKKLKNILKNKYTVKQF
jgi:isopropylmalate/homocitrate/citramalate synthase